MDLNTLLDDLEPEELEARLEMQVLTDPHGISLNDTNNNNCTVAGACNIKLGD